MESTQCQKPSKNSTVRGYHVYQDLWKSSIGEKLVAKQEFNDLIGKHAMKEVKGNETVGHLPRKLSQLVQNFLGCTGDISVEVIDRRRCEGMEMPCQLENCSKYK